METQTFTSDFDVRDLAFYRLLRAVVSYAREVDEDGTSFVLSGDDPTKMEVSWVVIDMEAGRESARRFATEVSSIDIGSVKNKSFKALPRFIRSAKGRCILAFAMNLLAQSDEEITLENIADKTTEATSVAEEAVESDMVTFSSSSLLEI